MSKCSAFYQPQPDPVLPLTETGRIMENNLEFLYAHKYNFFDLEGLLLGIF
jgi:hypothetical protein